MAEKALSGIKVLDLTRFFAGPFCTMLLGDIGADVVKVESERGDPTREQGPPFYKGLGMTFLSSNRNKKSIIIDMKTREGLDLVKSLIGKADVLVENFRPGVMERLGLGYDALSQANPRLIYATMSGLGADGPQAARGGFDITVQAEFGFMSITGEPGGRSVKLGTSVYDLVCGLYAYSGILAALYQREQTGRGQRIETSLMEGEVTFLADAAMEYLTTGVSRDRLGSEHANIVPYKVFQAADGEIVIGAGYQDVYEKFMRALGREELIADPRFLTLNDRVNNRVDIYREIDPVVAKYSIEALSDLLNKHGVPWAPVNKLDKVFAHEQLLARNMLLQLQHASYGEIPSLGAAVKFSGFDVARDWSAPPMLGEHTDDVLKSWLGN